MAGAGAPLLVRRARLAEAGRLSALCQRSKAHWGYDAPFMRQSREALRVRPSAIAAGNVLVAADARDLPRGMASISRYASGVLARRGDWELAALFVEPEGLRGGVGRLLFRAACGLAAGRGARRLVILSDPHAEGFYLAMGAVRIGMAPSDAIPGRSLPLLALTLPPVGKKPAKDRPRPFDNPVPAH